MRQKTTQDILEGSVQREPTNDMILSDDPLAFPSRGLRSQNSCINKVKSENKRTQVGKVYIKN